MVDWWLCKPSDQWLRSIVGGHPTSTVGPKRYWSCVLTARHAECIQNECKGPVLHNKCLGEESFGQCWVIFPFDFQCYRLSVLLFLVSCSMWLTYHKCSLVHSKKKKKKKKKEHIHITGIFFFFFLALPRPSSVKGIHGKTIHIVVFKFGACK